MTQLSRSIRFLTTSIIMGVALIFPLSPIATQAQNSTRYDLGFGPSFYRDTSAYHGTPANYDWAANGGRYSSVPCSDGLPGLKDGHCGDPNLPFGSISNSLGLCTIDRSVSCIESLEISVGGKWISASAEMDIPACCKSTRAATAPLVTWSSIPEFDISASNRASLFRLDGVVGVPRLWYVIAFYRFELKDLRSSSPRPQKYTVEVAPVEMIPKSGTNWNSGNRKLEFTDDFELKVLNESNFQSRLTLNLKSNPSTWIKTHLTESTAEITQSTTQVDRYLLRVAGTSSKLPSTSMSIAYADEVRRDKLCSTWTNKSGFCGPDNEITWGVIYSTLGTQNIPTTRIFEEYASKINLFPELDRATKEENFWTFSFSMSNPQQLQGCPLASGIYGLVGGNSMLISDDIPYWNSTTQTVEFTVASPHYRPNGEVAKGFYEMQLNEEVARCLWGTRVTPQNVSFSLFDDEGETKVAVATVAVRNGAVIFRASGYTYSITKLQVSLKKSLSRIRCVKSGVTKLQPKKATTCPKGWRKK